MRVLPQGARVVRSGLLPREDRASNLVGPVRDRIGLLGRRRPFQAVRHFGRKWETCTPSTLQREALVSPAVSWGTLGAHVVEAKGARRGCNCA